MDITAGLAWIAAGAVVGGVVTALIVTRRKPSVEKVVRATAPVEPTHKARGVAEDDDVVVRYREANQELSARLDEMNAKFQREVDALRKAQAMERASAEEELRRAHADLKRMAQSAGHDAVDTQSFEPTQQFMPTQQFTPSQFEEAPPPPPQRRR